MNARVVMIALAVMFAVVNTNAWGTIYQMTEFPGCEKEAKEMQDTINSGRAVWDKWSGPPLVQQQALTLRWEEAVREFKSCLQTHPEALRVWERR